MTKNNLRQHLDWILGSRPCFPIDNGQFAHPVSSQSPPEALPTTEPSTHSTPMLDIGVEDRNNDTGPSGGFQFVRPAIPCQVKRADSEDMARLQSGPGSSQKSRLLSQTIPAKVKCPTPYSSRLQGSTLRDQYSAAFDGVDRGEGASPRIGNQSLTPNRSCTASREECCSKEAYQGI